jgi:hypothetical protein
VTRRTLDPAGTIHDAVPSKRRDGSEDFGGAAGIPLAGLRERIRGGTAR